MAIADPVARRRYQVGQQLLLKRPAHPHLQVPSREPLPVTLRAFDGEPTEGRDHVVTIDGGPLGGLKLWAAKNELLRPAPPPTSTAGGRR